MNLNSEMGLSPGDAEMLAEHLGALQSESDITDAPGAPSLFDAIAAETVDRPRGLRDRLADLPTPVRIAVAAGLAGGFSALLIALTGVRPQFNEASSLAVGLSLGGVFLILVGCVALALRGLHERPLGPGRWLWVLAGVGAPVALSLVPGLWGSGTHAPASALANAFTCGGMGTGVAAIILGMLWLFSRRGSPIDLRVGAAAGVGGLGAFALLQVHCPYDTAGHMLMGHASVGLVLAAAGLMLVRFRTDRTV